MRLERLILRSRIMKRFLIFSILSVLIQNYAISQGPIQDNFGVHAQLFGAGVNYEFAVGKAIAVNTLITYEGGFYQGLDGDVNYVLTTTFGIEPRWYYNRSRREKLKKNIDYNVGNFLSGELFYASDLLSSSTDDRAAIDPAFAVGIKYGIRRKILEKLHFEFALGVGQVFPEETDSYTAPLIDIKFQYVLF